MSCRREIPSPLLTRGNNMALNVQIYKVHNHLTDEDIVMPRLVNQQSLDFNTLCEYLADGSTVTAADVAAVMKQMEMRLPLLLGLNAKVVCSPEGLTFRPKVSGSITQSQLKKKLQAKLAADPSLDIDIDRVLSVSDLAVSDLTAEIAIELPKKWTERFQSKATFKRVNKATNTDDTDTGGGSGGTTDSTDGTETGGTTTNGTDGTTDSTDGTDNSGGEGTNTNGTNNSGGGGDDDAPLDEG